MTLARLNRLLQRPPAHYNPAPKFGLRTSHPETP